MAKKETSAPRVIPDQVLAPQLRDYLEVMSKAVFQAGQSWAPIAKNWDVYLASFDRFEPTWWRFTETLTRAHPISRRKLWVFVIRGRCFQFFGFAAKNWGF